jgi:hypothetical protein
MEIARSACRESKTGKDIVVWDKSRMGTYWSRAGRPGEFGDPNPRYRMW